MTFLTLHQSSSWFTVSARVYLVYSQHRLKRYLYKTDTRSWSLPLYSLYLTLYKTDFTLKTDDLVPVPKVSVLGLTSTVA